MFQRLGLLAILAVATACAESIAPLDLDDPNAPGTVTFTYGGSVVSGTFNAGGHLPPADPVEMHRVTWTQARHEAGRGAVIVEAQLLAGGESHYVLIYAYVDPPGSARINVDCGSGSVRCTAVIWWIDADPSRLNLQNCGLGSGTVTVTAISSARVRGTFSGSGMCITPTQGSFAITDGTFDVPLAR